MSEQVIKLLITGTLDTLQMTVISTIMAMIIGIPLGVVLVVTSKGHILENAALNKILGAIVNATRSIPFIILMVAIIPFTRMVVGTSIGHDSCLCTVDIGGDSVFSTSCRNIH